MSNQTADVIAYNGKIATQNEQRSMVEAVAIRDGKFLAVGTDREMMAWRGEQTQLINLNKRTAIPGLTDSHTHLIRGGHNYNLTILWDGVPPLPARFPISPEPTPTSPPPHRTPRAA